LSAVAMGANYDSANPIGVYAPLLILGIPIFDTVFVAVIRIIKKQSPFEGSKDHLALRLEKLGLTRPQIVFLAAIAALIFSLYAVLAVKLPVHWAVLVYVLAAFEFAILGFILAKIKVG